MTVFARLRRTWEKNSPELLAAMSGRLPPFILARSPQALAGDRGNAGVPVFCYHRAVRQSLDADLCFLRDNGYQTLDGDQLCDHLDGVRPAGPRSVVLTFDDGSASLYHVALPLLRQYDLRAVAFVAPLFHPVSEPEECAGPLPCTRKQIVELQLSGRFDVQSHTMSHRFLPRYPQPMPLTDASDAWQDRCRGPALDIERELAESKATLESWLDKPVRHIAFPAYQGTDDAITIGQRLGYRGFLWGAMPPSSPTPTTHIQRVSGEFVRRLPGEGRVSLASLLRARLTAASGAGSP